MKYAYENLKIPEREYLTKEMLYASKESYKVVLEILDKAEIVTQSTLQQGMLYGNTTMGDERYGSVTSYKIVSLLFSVLESKVHIVLQTGQSNIQRGPCI